MFKINDTHTQKAQFLIYFLFFKTLSQFVFTFQFSSLSEFYLFFLLKTRSGLWDCPTRTWPPPLPQPSYPRLYKIKIIKKKSQIFKEEFLLFLYFFIVKFVFFWNGRVLKTLYLFLNPSIQIWEKKKEFKSYISLYFVYSSLRAVNGRFLA